MEELIVTAVSLTVLTLCIVAISIGCSDGRIDYCYLEQEQGVFSNNAFRLRGHRNWREDSRFGKYPTLQEAVAAANELGCPLSFGDK